MLRGIRLPHLSSSSTRVLLLLVGIMMMVSIALCALAWRLMIVDRTVQQQRARERLEQAADLGSSALLQQLARTGDRLRAVLSASSGDKESALHDLVGGSMESTAVILDGQNLQLVPDRRLRYLPEPPAGTAMADSVFARGEALEYQHHEYSAASRWFRDLAKRTQGPIRAGALLRAARNEARQKRTTAALALYSDLAGLGSITVDNEPAELIGRSARLTFLTGPARTSEAASLGRDLESGRWQLSRANYEYYRAELATVAQVEAPAPIWEQSVEALVAAYRRGGIESGERVVWAGDSQPVLLVWRSRAGSLVGLAVTGKHVGDVWLAQSPGFVFGLETADRRTLVPIHVSGKRAERILSFANAHWRLIAAPATAPTEPTNTQSLLILGLSLVMVLVLTGSYAVFRAVSRELSVARLQTDFVAAVSHEFRSPLTTLRSMSEMLERGRVPTEERKQRYYGLMARETARLHRLVEDVLDFGRIDAGVRQYDFRSTDLSALVHQIVLEFQDEHASSGVCVELEQAPTPPVLADVEALRRALHNLLDNALKYSPGQNEIRVSIHAGEKHVSISVEDRGMGIAPDELRRIFSKFERGAAARASSIRGTGLGLAMVQAIMTAHGGSVSVDSELDRGSTFTLVLPGAATAQQRVVWHAS